MFCIINKDLYILIVGGSMQVFLLILILILYFIMWCSIRVSSDIDDYEEMTDNIFN